MSADHEIARRLGDGQHPVIVALNKIDRRGKICDSCLSLSN